MNKQLSLRLQAARLGLMAIGASTVIVACGGGGDGGNDGGAGTPTASVITPDSTAQVGPSLIGLDPVNNAIWVPSYTKDGDGHLQYVLVPTANAIAGVDNAAIDNPRRISLPGCNSPVGIAYARNAGTFLIECGDADSGALRLHAVNATDFSMTSIALDGFAWSEGYGGIVYNPTSHQALIAGSTTIGLLDVPDSGTPVLNAASLTTLPLQVQSMSLNFQTGQALATQGFGVFDPRVPALLIDATTVHEGATAPLAWSEFETAIPAQWGDSDGFYDYRYGNGAVFDPQTNVLAISRMTDNSWKNATDPGFGQAVFTYNLATLSSATPQTADYVVVPGIGTDIAHGQNTGGVAALNMTTHQALIADAFGPNFVVVQLPTSPLSGAPDNRGQPVLNPATGKLEVVTTPGASSAYGLFSGYVPPAYFDNTYHQFSILGAPAAASIDQVNNIAYLLADDFVYVRGAPAHPTWSATTGLKLHLVAVDLTNPKAGENGGSPFFMNPSAGAAVVALP